jgi:hypothetical protein
MKSDEQRVDLAPLDPGGWKQKSAALAARALEQRRFRRAVVVRGMTALALSAAAALSLWFAAPAAAPQHDASRASSSAASVDMLDWAIHIGDPTEALRYAQ